MKRWEEVSRYAGRNDMPALMIRSWPEMSLHDQRWAICESWRMAEWPEQHIEGFYWTSLFDQVGYVVDGEERRREDDLPEKVTLWRGCTWDRVHGLSWTSSEEQARWFATRFTGMHEETDTVLVKITVERDLILARLTGRGEDEHVVDIGQVGDDEPEVVHKWEADRV